LAIVSFIPSIVTGYPVHFTNPSKSMIDPEAGLVINSRLSPLMNLTRSPGLRPSVLRTSAGIVI
jgi:hypothetical protein